MLPSLHRIISVVAFGVISLLGSSEPVHALNLNPIESALLTKRLSKIQHAVRAKFAYEVAPSLFGEVARTAAENCDAGGERDVAIIFPGAGGRDVLSDEVEDALGKVHERGTSSRGTSTTTGSSIAAVATFDWVEHRGSVLTAALDGEAVGESVAGALWGMSQKQGWTMRSVHCVGISVGAFAAHGMSAELCRLRRAGDSSASDAGEGGEGGRPYVRLTLLDPFTARGVLGPKYGPTNFGKDVDYSVQYLNTDDPVPTTNEPLPLCACYDVTNSKERDWFELSEGDTMHAWPVAYYARFGVKEEDGGMVRHGDGMGLERGEVYGVP